MFSLKHFKVWKVFNFGCIFFILTIIGTLSHECGHYLIAEIFNFHPTLHYGSVSYNIEANTDSKFLIRELFVSMAGPMQTMITGFFGLFIVKLISKDMLSVSLMKIKWIGIFLTFFWLRQIFNLFINLFRILKTNEVIFKGDEAKISKMLSLHDSSVSILTGFLGIIIVTYVVFYHVPISSRINLLIGGFVGSLISYIIWFNYLGKIILT